MVILSSHLLVLMQGIGHIAQASEWDFLIIVLLICASQNYSAQRFLLFVIVHFLDQLLMVSWEGIFWGYFTSREEIRHTSVSTVACWNRFYDTDGFHYVNECNELLVPVPSRTAYPICFCRGKGATTLIHKNCVRILAANINLNSHGKQFFALRSGELLLLLLPPTPCPEWRSRRNRRLATTK